MEDRNEQGCEGVGDRVRHLREKWESLKILPFEELGVKLEFDYSSPRYYSKHIDITPALRLWKFVIDEMQEDSSLVRREFLNPFVKDNNPLVALVSTIESLPTSVWRQILWKHNIDFMSFESFLRRIKGEKIKAISQNYHDLFSDSRVPRIFGWLYRYKNKPTVWDLHQEKLSPEKRYLSKGSWSYNLLDLDFGFNAYPGGEKDDTEVRAMSAVDAVYFFVTKFLSVKNHANDFVVSQEGGKYWWLYKKARSNYAYFPNRKVRLGTHICPGFWYTILIHLWFWLVSPILFVTGIKMLLNLGAGELFSCQSAKILPVILPGLLTPLWVTVAFIKLSYKRVMAFSCQKAISDWLEDKSKYIPLVTSMVFITLVSVPAIQALLFLVDVFGVFHTLWVASVVLMFAGYAIYFKVTRKFWPKFKHYPIYLKIPIAPSSLYAVYRFFVLYREQIVHMVKHTTSLITALVVIAYGVVLSSWIILLVLIVPCVFFAGFMYTFFVLSEEKQAKVDVYIEKGSKYLCLLLFVAIVGINFSGGNISVEQMVMNLVFIFSLMCFGLLWLVSFVFNPENLRLSSSLSKLNKSLSKMNKRSLKIRPSLLAKSEWLKALDKDAQIKQLERICSFILRAFESEEYPWALKILIPQVDFSLLDKLELVREDICFSGGNLRILVLKRLVDNPELSFKEALNLAIQEEEAEKRQREKTVKVFKIIFFIPYFSYKAIAKLVEYSKTLYILYDLFNKRCPDRHQPEVIKIAVMTRKTHGDVKK